MDILEFCRGIDLMDEAVELIRELAISEEDYKRYWELSRNSYQDFCGRVKEQEGYRGLMLAYLCRFSCEMYPMYKERGIEACVFWDTFRDIRHWCENCFQEFGEYGIDEANWFWRHLQLKIFKLGRLQFETMEAEHDITGTVNGVSYHIPKGESLINVHIPQGEPLRWTDCEQSFLQAYTWFGKEIPYICHSWLLYPGLKELLGEESNIIQFQNKFVVLASDFYWRDAERRIFGKVNQNPNDYPEQSSLQRAAKRYLKAGNRLGNAIGVLLPLD